jgi:hypothetical protein
VHIYGSWAARYRGEPGPPPADVDVMVVGNPTRADVYAAADTAQDRLGLQVNPTIRTVDRWEHPTDALVAQIKTSPLLTVYEEGTDVDPLDSGRRQDPGVAHRRRPPEGAGS